MGGRGLVRPQRGIMREITVMMEMFCILIPMAVTQIYFCGKITENYIHMLYQCNFSGFNIIFQVAITTVRNQMKVCGTSLYYHFNFLCTYNCLTIKRFFLNPLDLIIGIR